MRFYNTPHKHYCGVDLHARSLYLCIINREGVVLLHRSLPCDAERFLLAIAPFREDLVVAVECVYSWYWLADLCAKHGIPFVLGHALYMKAIHGAKAKNDRIDSKKVTVLVRGGLMPQAYAYPAEMRATRDLMRRRLHFVRQRGALLAHIQITHHQYNLDAPGKRITYRSNREGQGKGSRTRAYGRASPPTSPSPTTSRSSSVNSSWQCCTRRAFTIPTRCTCSRACLASAGSLR